MEKQTFDSVSSLQKLGMNLDRAEERIALTQKEGFEAIPTERYKGIWNVDNNALACIAGEGYKIIQHGEVVQQFAEVLGQLGLEGDGQLWDMRDRVEVKFVFKNLDLVDDGKKGIKLGVRLVNSYNKQNCLTGELYAWRLVCSNGMVLGSAINNIALKRHHSENVDVRKEMREFIKRAIESEHRLKLLVSEAMKDTLEWEYCEKLLEVVVYQKKYREMLQEELQGKKKLTRWDLYNAMTNIASHGEDLSFYVENYLQRQAQKVLLNQIEIIEK